MPITVKVPIRKPHFSWPAEVRLPRVLRPSFGSGPNIGREDRFVRVGAAVSAAGLGVFGPVASGQISVVSLMFLTLAAYLTWTAIVAVDPLYVRYSLDTRSERELLAASDMHADEAGQGAHDVDLRQHQELAGTSAASNAGHVSSAHERVQVGAGRLAS